jgi:hypothetical protein
MQVHLGPFSALSRIKDLKGSDYDIEQETVKMYKVKGPLQLYIVPPLNDIDDVENIALESFLFIEEGEFIRIFTNDFPHIFTNKNRLWIKVCDGATNAETDRFILVDQPHIVNPKDPYFNDIEKVFVEQYEIYNIKEGNSYVVTHK